MKHELKIVPKYFKDVVDEKKTFEVRKNDRNYQIGDTLILKEYDPTNKSFTGNYAKATVMYILKDKDFPIGIKEGYCIMALYLQNSVSKVDNFIKCFDEYGIMPNKTAHLKTEKEKLYDEMRERLMHAHEKGE